MDTQVEARFFQCPVDAGLALMAGKWKPRLLWKLYRYQTMRFGQFKRMG
jgi:DNA-binding HxlR family transcriptional regulator